MEENVLEQVYQENLEERLIIHLAEQYNMPLEKAMDIYYHSNLTVASSRPRECPKLLANS